MMPSVSTDGQQIEMQILAQLRRVTEGLDNVGDRMVVSAQHSTPALK